MGISRLTGLAAEELPGHGQALKCPADLLGQLELDCGAAHLLSSECTAEDGTNEAITV